MSTTIFADRLRLACDEDLGRAYLAAGPDDAEKMDPIQQLVAFDVPKQDYGAYQRACAAFNAVMDEHELETERKNARRRKRSDVGEAA